MASLIDITSPRAWNRAVCYAVAPVTVALALLSRMMLNPILHDASPFMYFFVAIIVTGWLGGLGPGVIASILSTLAVDYFYLSPSGWVFSGGLKYNVQSISFLVLGMVISLIINRMRREQLRAEQSEQRLNLAQQAARIGSFDWNIQTDVNVWTPELEAMYGLQRGEFGRTQTAWEQLVHPEDRQSAIGLVKQAFETGLPVEGEWRVRCRDGSVHWIFGRFQLLKDKAGKPLRLTGVNIDITQRKQAEEALRRSEDRLRRAIAIETVGVIFFRTDGSITEANDAFLSMSGYSREDLDNGQVRWDVMTPPEFMPESPKAVEEFKKLGQTTPYEKQYLHKDGSRWWGLFSAVRIADEEGVEFIIDISERKRMERHLKDSERRLTDIIEFLPDATFALDNAGRVIAWNKAMEDLTGAPAAEVLGKGNHEHTYRLYGKRIPCLADEMLRGDRPEWGFSNVIQESDLIKAETYIPHLKPGGVWLAIKVAPIYDAQGNVVGVIDACRDVTESKRAEDALRASEERYRVAAEELQAVMDATPAGICVAHDPQCRLITGNRPAHELFGVPPGESISATPPDRDTSPYFRIYREGREVPGSELPMQVAAATGAVIRDVELVAARRDGSERVFLLNAAPLRSPDGTIRGSVGAFTDITERKRAEERLRQSEQRLSVALGAGQMGTFSWDPSTGEVDCDPRHCVIWGFDPSRRTVTAEEIYARIHPEDLSQLRTLEAEALRSGYEQNEFRIIHPDGHVRWLAVNAAVVGHAREGRPRMIGVNYDITERKRVEEELRVVNERLKDADRRKDEFMAMLAHELRNPLAPIRYASQMLRFAETPQESYQKQREVIDRQVSHMGRLLDDLLDISRITRGKITLKREIVDLRTIATQAIESMRPMIEGREQHLCYEGPSSALLVDGDPTRLEQIIRNILHNANKYTEAGGCITLSLGLENGQAHEWRVVIRVIDSGIGIAADVLPLIFEAFVQAEQGLARSQGGLGIGLAMVRKLVELHSGSVEAHSAGPGRGSEFVVHLPLAEAEAVVAPKWIEPGEADRKAQVSSCRVLVVDDNEDSAASLSELLRLWGYQVQTAYDGPHALEAAREWRPEVILLDIGLPGMDGYQVAGHLRREPLTERAYIVALTGYGAEEDRRRAQDAGFDHHLTKPVELERLQKILNRSCAA